jgi:predicted N-acetyltransferase YhbS
VKPLVWVNGLNYQPMAMTFDAVEDDEQVAHVGMDYRTIRVGSDEVTVAAVGWVITRDDRRHLGLASSLMRVAHARARSDGRSFAVLFTGVPGLYHPLGYTAAPNVPGRGAMVASLDGSLWSNQPVDLMGPEW